MKSLNAVLDFFTEILSRGGGSPDPPSELRRFFCEIVTIERRTARFRSGQAEQPLLSSQDGNAVSKQHVPCRRDCEVCLENKGSAEPPRVPPNQLSQEGNWKLVFPLLRPIS